MTVQEVIQNALNHIALASQESETSYPYDTFDMSVALPLAEIAQSGFMIKFVDDGDSDVLPRLLVQSIKGEIEIERSPFALLVLMSSNDSWDGAEVAGILQRAGITAIRLSDFDAVPDWHGIPAVSWLFPQRLSEAFSLLDALHDRA